MVTKRGGVKWTDAEVQMVVKATARIIFDNPKAGRLEAVKSAQFSALPLDRHMSAGALNGIMYSTTTKNPLKKLIADEVKNLHHKPLKETSILWREPEVAPAEPKHVEEVVIKPAKTGMFVFDVDALVSPIVEAFRSSLRKSFEVMLQDELSSLSNRAARALKTVEEIKKLPKIVLLGPKGGQQTILKKEFDGVLNLSIHEDTASKDALKNADRVVIWADFISHGAVFAAKKHATNRVVEVKGGIEALCDELTKISCEIIK